MSETNATVEDLRPTIIPKSDQLNAEQLLGGEMTIIVTDVRMGTDEQPVVIHYQGDDGRPYKPAKTMRKVLIFAWGEDGRQWIGKSMTLFNDQAVRFGGMTVGGIRISHLSDIDRDISISLTATKGKKAQHTIQRLDQVMRLGDVIKAIGAATDRNSMNAAKKMAQQLTAQGDIDASLTAYNERVQALRAKPESTKAPPPEGPTYADLVERLKSCSNADAVALVLDAARHLPADQQADLQKLSEDAPS